MRRSPFPLFLAILVLAGGCAGRFRHLDPPDLPEAVSNNAVTSTLHGGGGALYSFMGINDPTDVGTITARCYKLEHQWQPADEARRRIGHTLFADWERIADAPLHDGRARIAASAVNVAGRVFLIGGYSVLEDGNEVTDPRLLEYLPETDAWTERARVPVEVDDTVALVYRDRYIYLVSGWHGPAHDNVLNVQLYDTENDTWQQCTPLPGPSTGLFGHAGVLISVSEYAARSTSAEIGDRITICDGVMRNPDSNRFEMSSAVWVGEIHPQDPTHIEWTARPPHGGKPTYRAAIHTHVRSRGPFRYPVHVVGGATNPYNISGTGYNGEPSFPLRQSLRVPVRGDARFEVAETHEDWVPVMDLRGMARADRAWYTMGGMTAPGTSTDKVSVVLELYVPKHGYRLSTPPKLYTIPPNSAKADKLN